MRRTAPSATSVPTNASHPRMRCFAGPRNGSATMMRMPKKHRTSSGARRCRFASCSAGNWITAAPYVRRWRRASGHAAAAAAVAAAVAPGASFVRRRAREALGLLDQAIGGSLHAVCEERRSDAHEENREGDGDENHAFAAGSIRQRAILVVRDLTKRDALVGP